MEISQEHLATPPSQLNIEEVVTTPPVFTGFEVYANNENGFFIINTADGSIFKWIDVEALECNGVYYGEKRRSKGGRRNFEGTVFNCFENRATSKGYFETTDYAFKQCIKKYGGFYMAAYKAKTHSNDEITFTKDGYILEMVSALEALEDAPKYAKTYSHKNNRRREFTSSIPCGAAYDCMFEEIFERFKKEVEQIKQPDELPYDAWNRLEKERRKSFHTDGVYGMFNLFSADGNEACSEFYGSTYCSSYRCGLAYGLYLISNREQEKHDLTASFPLGHRNFTVADARWKDHGYRIMLLPKNI